MKNVDGDIVVVINLPKNNKQIQGDTEKDAEK